MTKCSYRLSEQARSNRLYDRLRRRLQPSGMAEEWWLVISHCAPSQP